MKHYLLNIIQSGETPPPADVLEPIMRDVAAFIEELKGADALVISGGLQPPGAATVVRSGPQGAVTTDGPYIETREFIGGLCILRAPDHNAALAWADKASRATTLPIELREFQGEPAT